MVLSHRKHLSFRFILAGSIAAACAIIFLGTQSAGAQTVTWAIAGDGTWDTATGNWTGGSPSANLFVNGDNAIFNNSAGGTITLSGTISPTTTAVDGAGNYIFTGASLASGSLTKNGAGTLTLNASNGYAGGTAINSGSINLGNQNGFGAGTVTLAGGVNFVTGFEGNLSGGAVPNALILTGGKVTMNVAFGGPKDIWINTSVSGAGGFTIIGSGRDQGLTLDGAKTFTGGVTLGTVGSVGDIPNVSINDSNRSQGGHTRDRRIGEHQFRRVSRGSARIF